MRKKTAEAGKAVALIADVRASIATLQDEDLLDLADIFPGDAGTTLGDMAWAEMRRRDLRL